MNEDRKHQRQTFRKRIRNKTDPRNIISSGQNCFRLRSRVNHKNYTFRTFQTVDNIFFNEAVERMSKDTVRQAQLRTSRVALKTKMHIFSEIKKNPLFFTIEFFASDYNYGTYWISYQCKNNHQLIPTY